MNKHWQVLGKIKDGRDTMHRVSTDRQQNIIDILLHNRGLKTKKQIEKFLNPSPPSGITLKDVGIAKPAVDKAIKRIKKAIAGKEKIIVYSDYDVDGISGAAILWETLKEQGADILPYVPHRETEGYGMSEIGIDNILTDPFYTKNNLASLIITVDHGIVANKAALYAKKKGIEVIIIDHHEKGLHLPEAFSIVHTTKLCGAGVAWFVARALDKNPERHLDIAALATIADMVPLKEANRSLVKYGLLAINNTKRPGLLALFEEAGLVPGSIGTHEVGYMISPRLNAMGRLENAMDALRLLCVKNKSQAEELAGKLGITNRERQQLTEEMVIHARTTLLNGRQTVEEKLIFLSHESYKQGVIGLVAGKLCEEFYRPAIIISKGERYSKASARSIKGFNIIESIQKASEFLINCGGHPMAAGFTVETKQLDALQKKLREIADSQITEQLLQRTLKIDCEVSLSDISLDLYQQLLQFSPFGMENPEPVFLIKNAVIRNFQLVGSGGKHLKLWVSDGSESSFEAIGFGLGKMAKEIMQNPKADLVFSVSLNSWNGTEKLQLKIKDIRPEG